MDDWGLDLAVNPENQWDDFIEIDGDHEGEDNEYEENAILNRIPNIEDEWEGEPAIGNGDNDEAEGVLDDDESEPESEDEEDEWNDIVVASDVFFNIDHERMGIAPRFIENINTRDIFLMKVASSLKHELTYEVLLENCIMTNDILVESDLPSNKRSLWQKLGRNRNHYVRHLYCHTCGDYVGITPDRPIPTRQCLCGACIPGEKNENAISFVQVSLTTQLKNLFSRPDIENLISYRERRPRPRPGQINDIYDAAEYQRLLATFLAYPYNFSLLLWVDGVSVSKSSNTSAYPILFQLNELSPHARKKYPLLGGVWVADKHPPMTSILERVIDELAILHTQGIEWTFQGQRITSRFICPIVCTDSVARPSVMGMTQYNGRYGCTWCLSPGRYMNHRRVYPFSNYQLRTDAQLREHMRRAHDATVENNGNGRPLYGVKGYSALVLLDGFNLVSGQVVESLHAVFLGVVKRWIRLVFFGRPNDPWFHGTVENIRIANQFLASIRMPSRISRKARNLKLWKVWKATEWRNLVLYFGLPLLEKINADQNYIDHFTLLSRAIYTLNKDSVTLEEINQSATLLRAFHMRTRQLFGLQNMTFNIHLLLHLPNTVCQWGPMWVHGAGPFESWNRKIAGKITSSKGRALQVAERFTLGRYVEDSINDGSFHQVARERVAAILRGSKWRLIGHENDGVHFNNPTRQRMPNQHEMLALEDAGYNEQNCIDFIFFSKVIINGIDYQPYNGQTKFCNAFVRYGRNQFGAVVSICTFTYDNGLIRGFFIEKYRRGGNAFFSLHITNVRRLNDDLVFVIAIQPIMPAVVIDCGEDQKGDKILRAIAMPNIFETD